MWFATQDGLNRYDGYRFTVYRPDREDPGSVSHIYAWALHEDRSGVLWVGTAAGLDAYRRSSDRFDHYRHDPQDPRSLSHDYVVAIGEDRSGTLWLGTEGGGLNRRDRGSGSFWVGTRDGGLNQLDRSAGIFRHHRHDAGDPHSIADEKIYDLVEDRSGVLWLGTSGGVSKLSPTSRVFRTYRDGPGSPWKLGANDVKAIHEDRSGVLWVGTDGGGLNRVDRGNERVESYRGQGAAAGPVGATVRVILSDQTGSLWLGTDGGLDRFDPVAGRFFHYRHDPGDPDSLTHGRINALVASRRGELWIGTSGGSLDRLDLSTPTPEAGDPATFVHHRHDPGVPGSLSDDTVRVLLEDRSGALWIGTDNGLNRLDTAAAGSAAPGFTVYRHDPEDLRSLSADGVLALHQDGAGTLWLGTFGGGLNRLDRDPGTFTRYDTSDGLPNDVVYAIAGDDRGFLWLATNQGLSRFQPESGSFRNFDAGDGLQSNEFNTGAFFASGRGELFFGGIDGFNSFHPERLDDNPHPPPVVLTELRKLNRTVSLGSLLASSGELELSHEDSVLSFELAALDYRAPHKNRYAYRLEGLQDHWIDLGVKRSVTLTRLKPGRYRLRVKASNNDGLWNEEGFSVPIRVRPPPWATSWAYLLYASALAAAVATYLGSQKRKLERQRADAECERRINRRLRQLGADKDDLLAEKAAQVEERERLLDERQRLISELRETNAELTLGQAHRRASRRTGVGRIGRAGKGLDVLLHPASGCGGIGSRQLTGEACRTRGARGCWLAEGRGARW